MRSKRALAIAVAAAGFAPVAVAAAGFAPVAAAPAPATIMADYAGTYDDRPGAPIEIVADATLFAVVDEAKYPLTIAGPDVLVNASGARIPFRREHGRITGYVEDGRFHRRLSPDVSPRAQALARPRPAGQDDPAAYVYRVPPDRHDAIVTGDIAATALGRATARRIMAGILDGTWADVHSVLLFKDGKLVMEEYFHGYDADRPHQLRSATKSIVGAVAGTAVAAGALSGANERVLARMTYPRYDHPDLRKASITLEDLLTMRPGLDCDDHSATSPGRETLIDAQPDWVKATLDLPQIAAPGTSATYCSGAVAVTGRMVENAVHARLPDYAQRHLFGPLGIERRTWRWNYALDNSNRDFSQIHLRPRDMLKLGILYAEGGLWRGRRILSQAWVRASLSAQSTVDDTRYGYFWWNPWINVATPAGDTRVDYHAAQGNGGQKIYLLPQFGLVVVITAGAYNRPAPSNNLLATAILPPLLAAQPR